MKKALSPFINHQIRFYSIPHMFRFELFHGVCAMQYALFSTHSTLLPRRPERDGSTPVVADSSLDVALSHLSLVGGDSFVMECMGITASSKVNDVFSADAKRAAKVQLAFDSISSDIHSMEIDVVKRSLLQSEEKEQQANVTKYQDEITNHFLKSNSNDRGLILWLKKPSASKLLAPEPIHLKEVLGFLLQHNMYQSTGFDICEIYKLDIDAKYACIIKALEFMKESKVPPTSGTKQLDVAYLQHMKDMYCVPDVNEQELKAWSSSDSMKEILATALTMWGDIIKKRIDLPTNQCGEFGYEEFQLTKAEVVYYYERLSVTGICLVFLVEFAKELPINNEYSLVRLTRPSEKDINSANELRCRSEKRAAELDTFARGLLTKPVEHVAEGTEVVARQGLAGISNLQSNREKLAIDNVILNHSNNKRQRSTADDEAITNNCDGTGGWGHFFF